MDTEHHNINMRGQNRQKKKIPNNLEKMLWLEYREGRPDYYCVCVSHMYNQMLEMLLFGLSLIAPFKCSLPLFPHLGQS